MQSDGLNSDLNPVVYGDIVLSINTQYTMQYNTVLLIKLQCKYIMIIVSKMSIIQWFCAIM